MKPIVLRDHRTLWRRCPHCGALQDAAMGTSPNRKAPEDGAVLICMECGEWGFLDSTVEGHWRAPTPCEKCEVEADEHVAMMLKVVALVRAKRQ